MTRRRRAPKPPPQCFHCGRRLAWLPAGNDARKPVDPATRMILRDARAIRYMGECLEGEVCGFDIHGYLMAGTRQEPDLLTPHDVACERLVEAWGYHECDPIERAAYQAQLNHAVPATSGQDRAAGES